MILNIAWRHEVSGTERGMIVASYWLLALQSLQRNAKYSARIRYIIQDDDDDDDDDDHDDDDDDDHDDIYIYIYIYI